MNDYIKGNKAAWEEAFDLRDSSWGADIISRVTNEKYAFFNQDMTTTLEKYHLKGKTIGQFCCNNGRELLSLVKTTDKLQGLDLTLQRIWFNLPMKKQKSLRYRVSLLLPTF